MESSAFPQSMQSIVYSWKNTKWNRTGREKICSIKKLNRCQTRSYSKVALDFVPVHRYLTWYSSTTENVYSCRAITWSQFLQTSENDKSGERASENKNKTKHNITWKGPDDETGAETHGHMWRSPLHPLPLWLYCWSAQSPSGGSGHTPGSSSSKIRFPGKCSPAQETTAIIKLMLTTWASQTTLA